MNTAPALHSGLGLGASRQTTMAPSAATGQITGPASGLGQDVHHLYHGEMFKGPACLAISVPQDSRQLGPGPAHQARYPSPQQAAALQGPHKPPRGGEMLYS